MVVGYANLGAIYLALNRFDEARATTEDALGRKLEGYFAARKPVCPGFPPGQRGSHEDSRRIGLLENRVRKTSCFRLNPIRKPGREDWEKPASYPGKLSRVLAAAMKKNPPPYGKRTRRYAKRCSATGLRPARMLPRQWRSPQGATMRRRRQRWPMPWRAMQRTPSHLRMTSRSASRRTP